MANDSAASAAALAAFNAGKKKEELQSSSNTRDANSIYSLSEASKKSRSRLQPSAKPGHSRVCTPSSVTNRKCGNYSSDVSSSSATTSPRPPLKLDTQVRGSPKAYMSSPELNSDNCSGEYFELPARHVRAEALRSPKYSPHSPRDMIYNVKNSIDSKAIVNDASSKRLSVNYSPQEMLRSLKTSLNEKSKVSNNAKMSENDFGKYGLSDMTRGQQQQQQQQQHHHHQQQQPADSNRKLTASNTNTSIGLSPGIELNKNSMDTNTGIRYDPSYNSSYSSFESGGPTDNDNKKQVPARHGITLDVTDYDKESSANDVSIIVPVKSQLPAESQRSKSYIRRKPPPSFYDEECAADVSCGDDDYYYLGSHESTSPGAVELMHQMTSHGKSAETFSSGDIPVPPLDDAMSFTDNDDSVSETKRGDSKFIQFPDIHKHHHHSKKLFRSSNHQRNKGSHHVVFSDPDSDEDSNNTRDNNNDDDADVEDTSESGSRIVSPSTLLTGGPQPVQFRTTMRKTNKRKERKSKFNEYKPWKSHNDLNYLTEQERKRYEGVWVSNKGNYINFITTKLHGVNYSMSDFSKSNFDHFDDSMKAALISTNTITPETKGESSPSQSGKDDDTAVMAKPPSNIEPIELNQLILNAVVKRIWNRSRLPEDTLEQIWNLVDFRRDGTLNKDEFLVGMWLVDQCLYGRKLPKKVEPVVWESLNGIGVNINFRRKK
ncbi:IRS4 [Candida oxycetoniae]|uniref:IRS4 n=1 Tax=Candida oxycetoniae TaxID=497107 RepID=A0AAI9T0M2_9ASCO|nr:IRS4 [Candida oxycetoniae]KAI3406260.2 IRS4 [Candida oxycetoniae]